MDQKTAEKGENHAERDDRHHRGNGIDTREIEVSGDSIIISESIQALAGSIQELSLAIRNITATPGRDDDDSDSENAHGADYLDGSRRK